MRDPVAGAIIARRIDRPAGDAQSMAAKVIDNDS